MLIAVALATTVGGAGLAPGEAEAGEASVDDIRLAKHGDATRVVIDLSKPVSYRHVSLGEPPRLAIDLPEVDWTVDADASKAVGLVQGFRFGQPRPGVSRIVLDVAQPFEIDRVFELPPSGTHGHRIVTDLVKVPVNGRHQRINGAIAAGLHRPKPRRRPWWWCGRRQESPRRPSERIIVIDPGHGGVDPGAIGSATKLPEKEVALRMGLALRAQLEATGRYKVVMTRADDRIVRLRDRLQIARQSRGELFISLHADSLTRAPAVHGASVYTLSRAGLQRRGLRAWHARRIAPTSWPASICRIRKTSSPRF